MSNSLNSYYSNCLVLVEIEVEVRVLLESRQVHPSLFCQLLGDPRVHACSNKLIVDVSEAVDDWVRVVHHGSRHFASKFYLSKLDDDLAKFSGVEIADLHEHRQRQDWPHACRSPQQ